MFRLTRSDATACQTTRFVVVSRPRSGTHMLRTLLNQHPEIRTETELFNEHSQNCKHWRKKSARWVLDNVAWRGESQKTILGCLAHLGQGELWGVWQHLLTRDDVRYICMRRFNLLHQFVSLQQALVHQSWQTYRHDVRPAMRKLEIDPLEAEHYFRRQLAHWAWFEAMFAGRLQLTVWYEELCHDRDNASRRVQKFLGATVMGGLEPETVKIGQSPRDIVSNYDQLRGYFAGTEYEKFFEVETRTLRFAA